MVSIHGQLRYDRMQLTLSDGLHARISLGARVNMILLIGSMIVTIPSSFFQLESSE